MKCEKANREYIKSQIDTLSEHDIAKILNILNNRLNKKVIWRRFVRYPGTKKKESRYAEIHKQYIIERCATNDTEEMLVLSLNRRFGRHCEFGSRC